MPIYEYACAKCESEFEVEQRITEDPVKTCPKCRSRKVKRLISRTSFVLKGGGWYSDLYSSNDSSKDKEPEGKGDSGGETSCRTTSGSELERLRRLREEARKEEPRRTRAARRRDLPEGRRLKRRTATDPRCSRSASSRTGMTSD